MSERDFRASRVIQRLRIYLRLTVACALACWGAGMTLLDAVGHSFATVAIGGFSTLDLSMGHYDSSVVDMIVVIVMVLSGVNSALHFIAVQRQDASVCWRDSEFRFYLLVTPALWQR